MTHAFILSIAIALGSVNISGCTVGTEVTGATQDGNQVIQFRNGRYENSRGEEIKVDK